MKHATLNFIQGVGTILDLLPSDRPRRVGRGINLNRTDAEALFDDWERLSRDFRSAVDQTTQEVGDHGQPQ